MQEEIPVSDPFFSSEYRDDPPAVIARMRRLLSKALTPRAVARMEDHGVEVIEPYARPLRGATGVVDPYNQFFEPIPNTVVSRITGIPAKGDDERRFRELGRATLSLINSFLTEEERNVAFASTDELRNWIRDMTVERRRSPYATSSSRAARSARASY